MNRSTAASTIRKILSAAALFVAAIAASLAHAQTPARPSATQHPALFLVGDSIMKTGTGTGERGPWGWGDEIIPMFDAAKIHIYNEGRGGRSSRGYIEEGAWAKVLERIEKGDFVLLQFAHNDAANSQNYPDRISAKGNGDELQEVDAPGGKKAVHSYGWFLQQYVKEVKAKGATAIICSPVPRNQWTSGKIKRGFDGYAQWAEEAAKSADAPFIALNTLASDKYDALGQQKAASYFNDTQHTTKAGAKLNAESVVEGIKQLKDSSLAKYLATAKSEPEKTAPAEPAMPMPPAQTKLDLQPFDPKGNLNDQEDAPKTPRTGKILLVLAGDSTVTYSSGYAAGLRSHFDKQLQVINLSRGGRTTASFRSDGRWKNMLDLKPDYVLIQFGHNDGATLSNAVYSQNLARFVDEAREGGVKPLLATPVSRRYWQPDGTIKDDLAEKVAAMKAVAAEKKVPLLDLHERAVELYLKTGKEITDTWGTPKPDPANPSVTILDKTHFNIEGSKAMGKVVADELKRVVPELAAYIE